MPRKKKDWYYGEPEDRVVKQSLAEVEAGLPDLPFLFTLDQIGALCSMKPVEVSRVLFRQGVDFGEPGKKALNTINIGSNDEPMWRVDYKEFRRWCRSNKIPTYQW